MGIGRTVRPLLWYPLCTRFHPDVSAIVLALVYPVHSRVSEECAALEVVKISSHRKCSEGHNCLLVLWTTVVFGTVTNPPGMAGEGGSGVGW